MSNKYTNLLLNSLLFAINAFATKFVVFLLVPLYTYFMSPKEYGITDMSLTVISLVTPLATLSIADSAVRYIVGDQGREDRYVALSFWITLLSVVIVSLLTPFLDLSVFGGLGKYKVQFVFAYAASALLQLCSEVARGRGEVRLIPVCAAISSITTCILAGGLIGLCGLTVGGYFISVTVGPLFAVCIYLTTGRLFVLICVGTRNLFDEGKCSSSPSKKILQSMLSYSLPLIPNSLFWWISTSINRFFITGMLGVGASGLFAAAGKVPGLLNTAYSVFQQAWQLSAFQEAKNMGLGQFFSRVFMALQALMLVLCSALSFFAPIVAALFLQGEFFESWPIMTVLLLANLLSVFNAFFGTIYTTTMNTGYIMKTTAVGAVTCLVLTPLLLVPLGVLGACIASCCGNAVVLAMRAMDSKKILVVDSGWRYLVPCLVLIAVQGILSLTQAHNRWLLSGACFILVCVIQTARLLPVFKLYFGRRFRAGSE